MNELAQKVLAVIESNLDSRLKAELVLAAVESDRRAHEREKKRRQRTVATNVPDVVPQIVPAPVPVVVPGQTGDNENRSTHARGEDLPDLRSDPIPDLESVPSGVIGGLGEREPTISKRQATRAKVTSADFAAWFEAYPRKVGIRDAFKAWTQTAAERPPLALMLEALVWQRRTRDWTKDGGAFIPHPATYLRAGQWADQPLGKVAPAPLAPALPRAAPAPFTPPSSRGWAKP